MVNYNFFLKMNKFAYMALMAKATLARGRRTHDASKCRENGGFDNDCCALEGTASCADGFEMDFTSDVCYDGGFW